MTLVEHQRWCIRQLPITPAEYTVFWFLYGFDVRTNFNKYERHIKHLLIEETNQ